MLFGNSGKFSTTAWAEGDKVRKSALCFFIRAYDLNTLLAGQAECFALSQNRFGIGLMDPLTKGNTINPDMPRLVAFKGATQRLVNTVDLATCETDLFRQLSGRISHIQKTLEASELWALKPTTKNNRRVDCSNVHEKSLFFEFVM